MAASVVHMLAQNPSETDKYLTEMSVANSVKNQTLGLLWVWGSFGIIFDNFNLGSKELKFICILYNVQ